MTVIGISAAVGMKASNRNTDVVQVQVVLNHFFAIGKLVGVKPLVIDGKCGPKTVEAILMFQMQNGLISEEHFHGQIRPHGKTISFMNRKAGTLPASAKSESRTSPVNISVLQNSRSYTRGTLEWADARAKTWGDGERWIGIDSVAQLVRLVKSRCGDRGYVKRLRIGGHGGNTGFRLGNTWIDLSTIGALRSSIREIVPYFKPGWSLIYLDHCRVGQDTALLKRVSAAFGGVAVIAPLDAQVSNEGAPAFEGSANICGPGGCTRVATPNIHSESLLELLYSTGDTHPSLKGWDALR